MIFGRKCGKQALIESMKEKFKLVKKSHRYTIFNICDPAVKVGTQILAGKVMRECHAYEVSAPIATLAAQCAEGFQFNWSDYLHREFLMNCREA